MTNDEDLLNMTAGGCMELSGQTLGTRIYQMTSSFPVSITPAQRLGNVRTRELGCEACDLQSPAEHVFLP
jgi:hypothetical protein